ncbi:hypothetical protein [Spongiactinospora sp. TRM90649]|uniref:hypothetical protein n=1 Tax=Spongiactinospora sp. TRM90649 TaxID=3031114 RepID=UPI0023F8AC4B|nr:hypothetical protein [Spongiactinospora sp. TRM90649]MDF5758444.1 hypothetical protein [Spongiactinospora sp. TRM90649]
MAIVLPPAPFAVTPKITNFALGAAVAALVVAPVIVLRRRRWLPRLGSALTALPVVLAMVAVAVTTPPIAHLIGPHEEDLGLYAQIQYLNAGPAHPGTVVPALEQR